MVHYSLGKVYKIVCNITGETYIGSTCQKSLSLRLSTHKSKSNKSSSKQIIARGDYYIVLVEDVPCQNIDQLHARERHWIDNTKCVNKGKPLTDEEREHYGKKWREANPDYMRDWYEKNPDYLKLWNAERPDYHAKWYALHKQQAAEFTLNEIISGPVPENMKILMCESAL